MPFTRPTLAELVDRIQQDFLSRLSLSEPVLRRAFVYVLSRVVAGAAHLLHGHLDFIADQIFPDESDTDFLERQASLFGVTRIAASYASGNASFTGTNGTAIPQGTILNRADGAQYATQAAATIASGAASAAVLALLAGQDGNCDAGTALTLESPIASVSSSAAAAAGGLSGGADAEDDDALRARFIARLQAAPHGGNQADYVAWALEVGGVTRAWCYPLEGGAGTVTVRFVRDDDASIIPDAGEVAAVQAHIDAVRPVTATLTVVAPVADPIAFSLHVVPDTSDVRAAVTAELADLLLRESIPGGTTLISQIRSAIGSAAGLTDYSLASPSADTAHAVGHMATLGVITWT